MVTVQLRIHLQEIQHRGCTNTFCRYHADFMKLPSHNLWQSTVGCRQAKMFLQGPNKRLTCFAMSLSRKHLRIITGLLTGHVALNRHVTVMKIRTDPLCSKCGEEEETAYHRLGRCSAMMARYSIFGSYLMDITEPQQVQPHTLLRFAKASKRFI